MAMNIIKKLLIAPFACLALGSVLSGCGSATDEIDCSRTIFTPRDRSKMSDVERYVQDYFGEKYNVDIRYRYEDRFASNQYKLGPTDEMKALNYLNLIRYTFFDVYDKVAPAGFTEKHTIKLLVLFGTRGFGPTQNLLGEAPNGWIQVYNINELPIPDFEHYSNWYTFKDQYLNARDNYVQTLYHESAHTLHEERAYPPEFDKLSSLEYQKQDAFSYWWRTGKNAGYAGFVSDYASTDADEDFAELFAYYVLDSDSEWAERLKAAEGKNRTDAKYTGREIIEKKVAIMKAYLHSEYSADLDKIRAEAQKRLPKVATMDFTQYPKGY